MSYQRILIIVDSSDTALKAAKRGLELSKQLNAEAALIYPVDIRNAVCSVDAGLSPEEALNILKKEAEQTLDYIEKMYGEKDLTKFMPTGRPFQEITRMADDWNADLIVAGMRGRTGLSHLLVSSLAEHVLRHAKIPVMIVSSKL